MKIFLKRYFAFLVFVIAVIIVLLLREFNESVSQINKRNEKRREDVDLITESLQDYVDDKGSLPTVSIDNPLQTWDTILIRLSQLFL